MTPLILINPDSPFFESKQRLDQLLARTLCQIPHKTISTPRELAALLPFPEKTKILFAVHLGPAGLNPLLYEMVCLIRLHPDCLTNCLGSVIVDGCQEFYTKETGREIVFSLNQAGCSFPGRPLVEATGSLLNFQVTASINGVSLSDAYEQAVVDLITTLIHFQPPHFSSPSLLCIHSSNRSQSNTYQLWEAVSKELHDISITEFNARNGTITDCRGCPFEMCMHYAEKGTCFYGGSMVWEAYPAVEQCNGIILLAPNYNDALSASLTAFINRLTSLYRKVSFSEKYLFSIVVSGYSGSDIVANQIISALNMNKRFILPGEFALMETGNDPGSVLKNPGIEERILRFSRMIQSLLSPDDYT